jgi:hypothetical protein
MMKNFFKHPMKTMKKVFSSSAVESASSLSSQNLVKSSSRTLSESYSRNLDKPELDAVFMRMRRNLWRAVQIVESTKGKALATRETGKLASGQPYFYLKPFGYQGWLFERSDSGWVICRAEKIHTADTFIRSEFAWDIANCLTDEAYEATPRINSSRFELRLVSLSLYEEKIINSVLDELGR